MSVIHEALQRAERERSAGGVPKPEPLPLEQAASPARHARRVRLSVAAALGTALLVSAASFWALRQLPPSSQAPSPVRGVVPPSPPPPSVPAAPSKPAAPAPPPPALAAADTAPGSLDPEQLNARAVAFFRDGRPKEARRLLEQALRLSPAMPEAHNNFGMVLQAQGQRAEAKEAFLRALELHPEYPEALNNLGLVRGEEGNLAEAVQSFEKALAAKPDYSSAHLNLAIACDKLGRLPDALHHYRRFLETAGPSERELVRRVQDRLRRGALSPRDGRP